jgi:transposase
VEQFEQIRRDREREGLSLRALAERHGVHRRTVRAALQSPLPPAKRASLSRPAPKLGAYRELIDGWLIAGLEAPRKQRHTSKRIWRRLVDEHGVAVAETTVRDHVRKRRRELGHAVGDVFLPQVNAPGVTAEVDWGQADVDLAGARVTVHLFFMRSCFSGAAFSLASPVETQQAFFEGHAQAFAWFGGVFEEVRYDNLGSAVKKVSRAAGASSLIVSSQCARTTSSARCSRRSGCRARTRRAASRARSAASAATTSFRFSRSGRWRS